MRKKNKKIAELSRLIGDSLAISTITNEDVAENSAVIIATAIKLADKRYSTIDEFSSALERIATSEGAIEEKIQTVRDLFSGYASVEQVNDILDLIKTETKRILSLIDSGEKTIEELAKQIGSKVDTAVLLGQLSKKADKKELIALDIKKADAEDVNVIGNRLFEVDRQLKSLPTPHKKVEVKAGKNTKVSMIESKNKIVYKIDAKEGIIAIGSGVGALREELNAVADSIPEDISELTDTTGVIPTDTSDLTNGAEFITLADIPPGGVTSVDGQTGDVDLSGVYQGKEDQGLSTDDFVSFAGISIAGVNIDDKYVNTTGDTMTGDLSMGVSNRIF